MADLTQFVRGRAVIDRRGPTEGAHEVSCIDARLDRLRLHDAIPEPLMHLTCAARALRAGHVVVAGVELFCLSYLWLCACTNRRDKLLWAAITVLVGEGVGLVVGRGDCPLGPLQERLGDPVPLFELVPPRRAARAAVPIFACITCLGIGVLAARSATSRRSGH